MVFFVIAVSEEGFLYEYPTRKKQRVRSSYADVGGCFGGCFGGFDGGACCAAFGVTSKLCHRWVYLEVSFRVGEVACKTDALPASENGEDVFIPPDALPSEEEIAAANPEGRVLGWIEVQDDSDESGDTLDSRDASRSGMTGGADSGVKTEYTADAELIASGLMRILRSLPSRAMLFFGGWCTE
jgi:hypothetical protein